MGVMPLRDFNHVEYLQHEVPGMSVPEALVDRMWEAREDGAEAGRRIAAELIRQARDSKRLRGVVLSSANNEAAELVNLVREVRP